jgi:multidrug resistance efflux pump|tara:strand:+ start:96 stop:497 length:402 start_codon:yes stop_codon:yes gene_type:complete
MSKVFIGIIIMLGIACSWLWIDNQRLRENNAQLGVAVQTQEEAIATLQSDFATQGKEITALTKKSQEAQKEMNRYLDIFRRHNLTKLAAAKPGLIETRANKATKEVFDGIEKISRNIDCLDGNANELCNDKTD